MGLSSDILWHQTSEDGLMGIIKDECLYFSYGHETIYLTDKDVINMAIPMISVCDLPFIEIGSYISAIHKNKELKKDRIGRYGDYTIAFSKEWGRKNHFSTVWYCEKNSQALLTIRAQIQEYHKIKKENPKVDLKSMPFLLRGTLAFIKNYEGKLETLKYENYRFYDERELRLIADSRVLESKGFTQFLIDSKEDTIKISEKRKAGDSIPSNYLLSYKEFEKANGGTTLLKYPELSVHFDWNDVKYIIVRDGTKREIVYDLLSKKSPIPNIPIFTIEEVLTNILGTYHNRNI